MNLEGAANRQSASDHTCQTLISHAVVAHWLIGHTIGTCLPLEWIEGRPGCEGCTAGRGGPGSQHPGAGNHTATRLLLGCDYTAQEEASSTTLHPALCLRSAPSVFTNLLLTPPVIT